MTMVGVSKKKIVTCAEDDMLSNLPEHLIDSILERVPLKDGVRTSILSKNWRYRWTTMKALVFDEDFSNKLAKNGAYARNGFIRIITRILILHKSPISKFRLHIPNMNLDSFQEVDEWMLLLSRKGVKELALTNSNQRYEVPHHVFSCLELTKLDLENCFIKRPLEFEGFVNLGTLRCKNIDFGANICGTPVSLPQLKMLSLYECTNLCNINIKAGKLRSLVVAHSPGGMLLFQLLNCPILTYLIVCGISFRKPSEDLGQSKTMNMPTILCNFPRISTLYIGSDLLKDFIEEKLPKGPTQWVKSLKCLCLHEFQPGDLDQLHGVLYLLRNLPYLERLVMLKPEMVKKPQVINNDDGPASNHLQAPNCLDCTLNCLKIVKIGVLTGSRPELLFIKLLLAQSPSLEKLAIRPSESSDAQKRYNLAKDVTRFPRASTKAEIIHLDPEHYPRERFYSFRSP